jgi:hypothetical protein
LEGFETPKAFTTRDLAQILDDAVTVAHENIVNHESYFKPETLHIEPKAATTLCLGTVCR